MKLSFICHWNDQKVLEKYLMAKAFTKKGDELILLSECPSQAVAYSEGERLAHNETMVFIHQDIITSRKWRDGLASQIELITKKDPHWGVIGVLGYYFDKQSNWRCAGQGETSNYSWSHQVYKLPMTVEWIDGMICVKRKGVLAFDNNIPKFHGVMEDLCEQSRVAKRGVWVANLYTKHYSPELNRNHGEVTMCANYIIKKWDKLVPVGAIIFWPRNKKYYIRNLGQIMPLETLMEASKDGLSYHVTKRQVPLAKVQEMYLGKVG